MIISTNNFSYMQRFYGIVVPKLLVLATRKSLPNAPATFFIAVLIGKLAIPYKSIGCRFHWIPQAIVICDRCEGLVASGIKHLLLKNIILGRGLCLYCYTTIQDWEDKKFFLFHTLDLLFINEVASSLFDVHFFRKGFAVHMDVKYILSQRQP